MLALSPVKKLTPFVLEPGIVKDHDPRQWRKFLVAFLQIVSEEGLSSVFDTNISTSKSSIAMSQIFVANYEYLQTEKSVAMVNGHLYGAEIDVP